MKELTPNLPFCAQPSNQFTTISSSMHHLFLDMANTTASTTMDERIMIIGEPLKIEENSEKRSSASTRERCRGTHEVRRLL